MEESNRPPSIFQIINEDIDIIKVSEAKKYEQNPFVDCDYFKIDTRKKSIIVGSTKKILLDVETGETEGIAVLHKYKEIDKEQFVKLYVSEVSSLFDLSKAGLKVFGYILNSLEINRAEIYIHIPALMMYCEYKRKAQAYKGLSELISNKIIAMSRRPNIWYINPNIIFNGDRIAFIKQYRIKKPIKKPEQLGIFQSPE